MAKKKVKKKVQVERNVERNVEKKKAGQELKEDLENFMVKATSIVLCLAVLLAVFYNYLNSSFGGGMRIFVSILMWIGIAGVLAGAVMGGFVKKESKFYKWCGYGAADAILCFIILRLGAALTLTSGITFCYYALILYFIASLVYYFLGLSKKWDKKNVRLTYTIIFSVIALVYVLAAFYFMLTKGAITGAPIKIF
ncbi:MAG: hypothetical protein Q8882_02625 [Bacillota bacterium]|nr:hypothetical protein [Bacillota bacterium]